MITFADDEAERVFCPNSMQLGTLRLKIQNGSVIVRSCYDPLDDWHETLYRRPDGRELVITIDYRGDVMRHCFTDAIVPMRKPQKRRNQAPPRGGDLDFGDVREPAESECAAIRQTEPAVGYDSPPDPPARDEPIWPSLRGIE